MHLSSYCIVCASINKRIGVRLWQSTETIIAYYSNKRTASLSAILSSCLVVRGQALTTSGLDDEWPLLPVHGSRQRPQIRDRV